MCSFFVFKVGENKKALDFLSYIIYNNYELQNGGEELVADKKAGRPTVNPKSKPRQVRLDEESSTILEKYCIQERIPQSEGIRRGIKKLEPDIKK